MTNSVVADVIIEALDIMTGEGEYDVTPSIHGELAKELFQTGYLKTDSPSTNELHTAFAHSLLNQYHNIPEELQDAARSLISEHLGITEPERCSYDPEINLIECSTQGIDPEAQINLPNCTPNGVDCIEH